MPSIPGRHFFMYREVKRGVKGTSGLRFAPFKLCKSIGQAVKDDGEIGRQNTGCQNSMLYMRTPGLLLQINYSRIFATKNLLQKKCNKKFATEIASRGSANHLPGGPTISHGFMIEIGKSERPCWFQYSPFTFDHWLTG